MGFSLGTWHPILKKKHGGKETKGLILRHLLQRSSVQEKCQGLSAWSCNLMKLHPGHFGLSVFTAVFCHSQWQWAHGISSESFLELTQFTHLVFNLDLSVKVPVWVHIQGMSTRQRVKRGMQEWLQQKSPRLLSGLPPVAVVLLRFSSCNAKWRHFHQWITQTHAKTSWLQVTAKQQSLPELLDHLSWLFHLVHSIWFGKYYFRAQIFFLVLFL